MRYMLETIILITAVFFTCCSIVDNNDELPDFGYEEGYFIYTRDMEKIPWTRNRNYVSIEFYEHVSEEDIMILLDEYDLQYHSRVHPVKHIFARCLRKPAEEYYTTYGDTTKQVLGNRSEVRYALPVFMNEFWEPIMLTNRIRIRFDGLNEEQELAIIDSLISADNLMRGIDGPGEPIRYSLIVTKLSPSDPLTLSNKYSFIDNVRHAIPDYAIMLDP